MCNVTCHCGCDSPYYDALEDDKMPHLLRPGPCNGIRGIWHRVRDCGWHLFTCYCGCDSPCYTALEDDEKPPSCHVRCCCWFRCLCQVAHCQVAMDGVEMHPAQSG